MLRVGFSQFKVLGYLPSFPSITSKSTIHANAKYINRRVHLARRYILTHNPTQLQCTDHAHLADQANVGCLISH